MRLRGPGTATLEDNPSTRDLFSMVPLDLTIDDYSTKEKIAYTPLPPRHSPSGGVDVMPHRSSSP